jgi:ABC-2 type transport system ATP-binding protein
VRSLTNGSRITVRSSRSGLPGAAREHFGAGAVEEHANSGGGTPRFSVATDRPERAAAWFEERAEDADIRIHRPTLEDAFLAATGTGSDAGSDARSGAEGFAESVAPDGRPTHEGSQR